MKNKLSSALVLSFILLLTFSAFLISKKDRPAYKFKVIKKLPATSVKDQGRTGTCWIFSSMSFFESEILRKGGPETDLSEMFIARYSYIDKAKQYVYMHGRANFGPGGQFHDVVDQVKKHGLVPESIYPAKLKGQFRPNHGELGAVLDGFLGAILKRRGEKLSPVWMKAFASILNVYLGTPPEKFIFKDKEYTPMEFFESTEINPDDYIEITSYTHHPFYKKCRLELPDNWSYNENYYNVPIEDLFNIVNNSISNGYTFIWDADVSEKFFSKDRIDVSLIPEKGWNLMTREEQKSKIKKPVKEKVITQKMRQESFENWTTTDDHLMHITGTASDQNGKKYFIMKNSWGTDHKYKGYFYISIPYFKLKTICIIVNKNSIPGPIKQKMGI